MSTKRATIQAVGDIVLREPGFGSAFRNVARVLGSSDLLFGNLEYASDAPASPTHSCGAGCDAGVLQRAGFRVLSCANDRVGERGPSGLTSSLRALAQHGIASVGAGSTGDEAWRPVFMDVGATRIAFLAWTAARDLARGGELEQIANLHPSVTFRTAEPNQPGTPPQVETSIAQEELDRVISSISNAASSADFVVASFHWGIPRHPYLIADYERVLGHAAVDAGANLVVGHHQGILKPIEMYRSVPILYGLGSFVSYAVPDLEALAVPAAGERYYDVRDRRYPGTWSVRPPRHRFVMIARCSFVEDSPPILQILPCSLDSRNRPTSVEAASPVGGRVAAYLHKAADLYEIPFSMRRGGNDFVVET